MYIVEMEVLAILAGCLPSTYLRYCRLMIKTEARRSSEYFDGSFEIPPLGERLSTLTSGANSNSNSNSARTHIFSPSSGVCSRPTGLYRLIFVVENLLLSQHYSKHSAICIVLPRRLLRHCDDSHLHVSRCLIGT